MIQNNAALPGICHGKWSHMDAITTGNLTCRIRVAANFVRNDVWVTEGDKVAAFTFTDTLLTAQIGEKKNPRKLNVR